jgi:SagB-type dehydrogenase family enzyme
MLKKMSRRDFIMASAATGALFSMAPQMAFAQEPKTITLSKPQTGSDKTLMQALWKRMSTRQFSPEPLPVELLSNLLWAGFGVNRPDGKRTAPTASNWQDIDIYVIRPDGAYVYDAKANQLKLIVSEDLRGLAATQAYAKEAPVILVYVSDYAKTGEKATDDTRRLFSGFHSGAIAQNIYLYCASEGLASVVRAGMDIPGLIKALKLRPEQKITLSQVVGYPKKA